LEDLWCHKSVKRKKSCQKVVKKLSKSCQKKVVKKLSKKLSESFQKVVKKLSKSCKKLSKSCQKVVKRSCHVSLVILCDTGSHLKEKINKRGGGVGGANSSCKAFGISFADRLKAKT
jgi:hypothetical protein